MHQWVSTIGCKISELHIPEMSPKINGTKGILRRFFSFLNSWWRSFGQFKTFFSGEHKQPMNFTPGKMIQTRFAFWDIYVALGFTGPILLSNNTQLTKGRGSLLPQLPSRSLASYFDEPTFHLQILDVFSTENNLLPRYIGFLIFQGFPRWDPGQFEMVMLFELRGNPWRNITWWVLKLKLSFPKMCFPLSKGLI